jgi:hypothetical protein
MLHDDPTAEQRAILRHRAGAQADLHWDETPDRRSETAQLVMRLSVIIAVGLIVTGVGLAVSQRLHPAREAAAPIAPAAPFVVHSDPPWTVPLPTIAPTPTPTSAPTSAPPTTSAAAPKPRRSSATPAVSRTTVRTTVAPKPTPTLLGPGGDDALEAALTSYCVAVRGDLAVAVRGDSTDGWDCRHAERSTAIAMNAACRFFYGAAAWSATLDDTNPYSWRCFRD